MSTPVAQPAAPSVTERQREVTVVGHDVGPIGGMPRHLSELVQGLCRAGHAVTVVSRTCDLDPHPRLRWVRVRGPARPFLVAYPWFFLVGSWRVWRHRRGAVHTTGAIVGNRADVSTVHLCHRAVQHRGRFLRSSRSGSLYRLNARAAVLLSLFGEWIVYRPGRTRYLVAVSNGVADELRRFFSMPADRVVTIPNGVDTTRFRPRPEMRSKVREALRIPADDLLLLFVGGEWEQKGLSVAVDAVARAPGWELVVVGAGDVPRYREKARRAGAVDRVHFVGETGSPEDYFAAADAFVLPSAYESFSLVAFEAAASGLPLLVSRVHGVDELLVDGENGWFVDRDPESVARGLHALGSDRELGRRMGTAARAAVADAGWERMVAAYSELYRAAHAETERIARDPQAARAS